MKITIGFELESGVDEAEMATWLSGVLAGESPFKKPRKPREPLTGKAKKAFRKRMVDGQKAAAEARAIEESKAKKPAKSKS